MAADPADFWVVVGTVAPVTIAVDVILIGQSIRLMPRLARREGEDSFTSWLRAYHMWFLGADLVGCLAVIGVCLYALWNRVSATWSAWLAAGLLFVVLAVLCVLAVCTANVERQEVPAGSEPVEPRQ